ncbi:uncharacterized protein ACB058_012648 isoform 1-T2 [Synchiropus picturatus]
MSTDRPKRNIIKKKYDISDGMPWCEERLVRKVLFLSLKEFRNTHRHTHYNSHTRALKCSSSTAPHRRKAKPPQQEVKPRSRSTHTERNKKTQNANIPKQVRSHGHASKVQKNNSSQDSHAPKRTFVQKNSTQSKRCAERAAQSKHQQGHKRLSHSTSGSTRTLRTHKTQLPLLHCKKPGTAKQTGNTRSKSVKTCAPENTRTPQKAHIPARSLRSHLPRRLTGAVVSHTSKCQPLQTTNQSWSWCPPTRPQHCPPASLLSDNEDLANKRPRLQAQRKFAQSPPSSPGPSAVMMPDRCNNSHHLPTVTCLTRRRPKTEDFLSFLCLRGSAALPNNMTFLASRQSKEHLGFQHLTSCLSINHTTEPDGKNVSLFRVGSPGSLNGTPEPVKVSPFCPLSARAQRIRERERRGAEQQQKKMKEGECGDGKSRATRRHLRPRQLLLNAKRNKKAVRTPRPSQSRASNGRSLPPIKSREAVGDRRVPGPSPKPSNTCKVKGQSKGISRDRNHKHLSKNSNHQLPPNPRLPLSHQSVLKVYCKPKTNRPHQNSGSRAAAQLTNGAFRGQRRDGSGIIRLSRRKRGLPPDTKPATSPQRDPSNRRVLKQGRTLAPKMDDGDAPVGETAEKDDCLDARLIKCPSDDREMRGNLVTEDMREKMNGEFGLVSITAVQPCVEKVITPCERSPVTGINGIHMRTRCLQRSENVSSTTTQTIRTSVSRSVTRAAASKGAKHGSSRLTSPASNFSTHNSDLAARDSTENSNKDSRCSSKGSTRRPSRTKSSTSATRTSPRILRR